MRPRSRRGNRPPRNGGITWCLEQFGKRWGTLALDQLRTKTLEDYLTERLRGRDVGDGEQGARDPEIGLWARATVGLGDHHPVSRDYAQSRGRGTGALAHRCEEGRLVAAAAPWLRDLILVGLDTGLRRSNLVGLQWSWLHEQGTVLVVPRQLVKAKKATVMIPLTTRAARIIARQVRHGDAPCVFTHTEGHAYSVEQVSMAVMRAAKQAQLSGVSLHTLRHTFISRLVQAGRPLPEVAALAGHRAITMTMRYAHLAPSHLRAGIQALEQRNTGQQTGRALSTESRWSHVIFRETRKCWCPQRDLNPCYCLERAMS